jgi:glycosyltransferase involved in cell wall biosynthesis
MISFVPMATWHGALLLARESFDVINAQFVVPSGIPAALLAQFYRIPFVVSFVGGDVYDPTKGLSPHRHRWMQILIRWVARQAVAGTAISQDTKRRAMSLHAIKLPITITHLGLVRRVVVPISRQSLGLPATGLVLISIGRLIPRKGYSVLLQALRSVKEVFSVIVGDGPLLAELQQLATEYGIADRVLFTGFISDERKLQLLAASDGYVSAALHEGFGIVFLEAMEAGLPIVAFREGGHCDFLVPEINALLASPGNQEEFERLLKRLVVDVPLRERMGQFNREAVKDFYVEKTTTRFENVLNEVIHHASRH